MRTAYKTLCGSLVHYWGYAPARPRRRAEAYTRFSAASPRGAALGRAGALGSPIMPRGSSLTPLANDNRKPVGGFDRRLGPLKTPRRVRSLRRYGVSPAAERSAGALVLPFFGSRGGWGEKGRREFNFLRADPWRPFTKRPPLALTRAALALWGPTTSRLPGTQGARGLALLSTLDGPGPDNADEGDQAPVRPALSQAGARSMGRWSAGLLGG